MHLGNVFDNVGAGLLVIVIIWLAKRVAITINHEQKKRCGLIVIGFYVFMAAYFVMSLSLASFGVYCVFGAIPVPWILRAIYGLFPIALGAAGLFQASAVLRCDPNPVNWKAEVSRFKAGLRQQLGIGSVVM